MEFKTTYTLEEIEELVNWFKTCKHEGELNLGEGEIIKDFNKAVEQLSSLAIRYYDNPNFLGSIHNLIKIRNKIEEENSKGE